MRVPRVFDAALPLELPEPDLGVFEEIASGPGWNLVPRCSMEQQKRTEWCWAAVGQCIERTFATSNPEQCALVQKLIPGPCCADMTSTTCNKPKELQSLLSILHHLADPKKSQVPFTTIVSEITAKKPVCCLIKRASNKNHFIVISGFRNSGGQEQIAVLDPVRGGPAEEYKFSAFVTRYEDGKWGETFLTR